MTPFAERLATRVRATVPLCVGLDPHLERLPDGIRPEPGDREGAAEAVVTFGTALLDALEGRVPVLKPQVALFEALGSPGVAALEQLVAEARRRGILVLLDAKRGDIGSTAEAYARATLDDDGPLGADAVTLSPYLGPESLSPFLRRARADKGLFVLVRTSNPGSDGWQGQGDDGVAARVANWIESASRSLSGDSGLGPVGAVVGATLPEGVAAWRARMPHAWLLVPGFGAQGGTLDDVRPAFREDGLGALVVSAREVLFPRGGRDGAGWQDALRARVDALVGTLVASHP